MNKELLQQALDALIGVLDDAKDLRNASISGGLYEVIECRDAIAALREAIAQPVQPAVQAERGWMPMSDGSVFGLKMILMWNAKANAKHQAGTCRIGNPLLENTSDCTHWMPLPVAPVSSNIKQPVNEIIGFCNGDALLSFKCGNELPLKLSEKQDGFYRTPLYTSPKVAQPKETE